MRLAKHNERKRCHQWLDHKQAEHLSRAERDKHSPVVQRDESRPLRNHRERGEHSQNKHDGAQPKAHSKLARERVPRHCASANERLGHKEREHERHDRRKQPAEHRLRRRGAARAPRAKKR
eukprot:Amastigsp_a5149_10.p2 type:complete len:121 gc:universal Amastigsp_a5149_10:648-286(-)